MGAQQLPGKPSTLLVLLQAQGNGQLHHSLIIRIGWDVQHGRETLRTSEESLQGRRVAIVDVLGCLQHHGLRLQGESLLSAPAGYLRKVKGHFTTALRSLPNKPGLTTISKSPWSTSLCSWLSWRMCPLSAIPEGCIFSSASSSSSSSLSPGERILAHLGAPGFPLPPETAGDIRTITILWTVTTQH